MSIPWLEDLKERLKDRSMGIVVRYGELLMLIEIAEAAEAALATDNPGSPQWDALERALGKRPRR